MKHNVAARMHDVDFARIHPFGDAVLRVGKSSFEEIFKSEFGGVFKAEPAGSPAPDFGAVARPEELSVRNGGALAESRENFVVPGKPVFAVVIDAVARSVLFDDLHDAPFCFQIILFRKRIFSSRETLFL